MSSLFIIMFYAILLNGDIMIYKLVENDLDIKDIEMMASIIWPITYKEILSTSQIKYMLNKYLSVDSIKNNIEKENYTYIVLYDDDKNKIGFMGYQLNEDNLFLSKLYLLPNAQNKGYASMALSYLKQFELPIKLTVNKYNKNAYDKYIHLGFKVIDSVVTNIGNDYVMDDYVMLLK